MMENSYVQILKSTLEERRLTNPSYSLRAFARDLEMEPANLSKVLAGGKGISENKAIDLCDKLGLSDEEANYFCDLVISCHARSRKKRELAKSRLAMYAQKTNVTEIKEDIFKVISDWYHFAILELITLKDFTSDPEWMAKKLGITTNQVELALTRLENLELIKIQGGKVLSTGVQLETTNGISSKSIKKLNSQLLTKASAAITSQNVNERHLSTLTTAIHKKDLKKYGEFIEKFKQEFNLMNLNNNKLNKPDEVYALTMQFFKLTK